MLGKERKQIDVACGSQWETSADAHKTAHGLGIGLGFHIVGKKLRVGVGQIGYSMFALRRSASIHDISSSLLLKPFFVFNLDFIPRRIATHGIEATLGEHFGELNAPMEETIAVGRLFHLSFEVFGKRGAVVVRPGFKQGFPNGGGRRHFGVGFHHITRTVFTFEPEEKVVVGISVIESVSVDVGGTAQALNLRTLHEGVPLPGFHLLVNQVVFGQRSDGTGLFSQLNLRFIELRQSLVQQVVVGLRLCFVGIAHELKQQFGSGIGVAFHPYGLKGIFGQGFEQHTEVGDTHHRIAATDMVVKEGERLASAKAFNPQHDLAQLHGIRVVVNGIDALLYHLAQGLSIVARSGVVLSSTHNAKMPCNGAGHGQHKVATATGGIAHFHVKQCPLALLAC